MFYAQNFHLNEDFTPLNRDLIENIAINIFDAFILRLTDKVQKSFILSEKHQRHIHIYLKAAALPAEIRLSLEGLLLNLSNTTYQQRCFYINNLDTFLYKNNPLIDLFKAIYILESMLDSYSELSELNVTALHFNVKNIITCKDMIYEIIAQIIADVDKSSSVELSQIEAAKSLLMVLNVDRVVHYYAKNLYKINVVFESFHAREQCYKNYGIRPAWKHKFKSSPSFYTEYIRLHHSQTILYDHCLNKLVEEKFVNFFAVTLLCIALKQDCDISNLMIGKILNSMPKYSSEENINFNVFWILEDIILNTVEFRIHYPGLYSA